MNSNPILVVLDRLRQAIELENVELRSNGSAGLEDHIRKKSHLLLEIGRAIAGLSQDEMRELAGDSLDKLKDTLSDNSTLLTSHMEVAREVSEIVRQAIQHSQSDGTYSPSLVPRRS